MNAKQRARLHAKMCFIHGNLEGVRQAMFMCRVRDRYKCHREDALKELSKLKPLLNDKQSARCNMLMLELKQGRNAPKIQATISKCKSFAWDCAQSV